MKGRPRGSKNRNGIRPWERYGLTEGAYYSRKRRGLSLAAVLTRGRKKSPEREEEDRLREMFGPPPRGRPRKGRFSGKNYDNPPEKLEVIKKKNRNGVTDDIMKEFESKWAKTENPFCP